MSALNTFLANAVTQIINPLILLLSAGAFVVFIWGVFEFIKNAGNEVKRGEGRKAIFWGIIGLVIIFGAYGIINFVMGTFSLTPNNQTTIKGVLNPPSK